MYRIIMLLLAAASAALPAGFESSDFLKLRSAGTVQFSPDGSKLAYTINRTDGGRRAFAQLWIMTLADGKSISLSSGDEASGDPEWSPDGKWIAFSGRLNGKSGLILARADGTEKKYLGPLDGTNSPLPTTGKRIAWSPDIKQIAYVSAQPGPETARPRATPSSSRVTSTSPPPAKGIRISTTTSGFISSWLTPLRVNRGNSRAARTTNIRSIGRRTARKSLSFRIASRTRTSSSTTICWR